LRQSSPIEHTILIKSLTDKEYEFYWTMLLLEACCVRTEIPLLVIKTLVKEVSKHKLSQEMEVIAIDALNYLRAEVIYDFV
jgi:hypothetical protein